MRRILRSILLIAFLFAACSLEEVAIYGIYNQSTKITVRSIRLDKSDNQLLAPVLPGEEFAFTIKPGKYDVVVEGDSLRPNLTTAQLTWTRSIKLENGGTYADTLR